MTMWMMGVAGWVIGWGVFLGVLALRERPASTPLSLLDGTGFLA